jgi:hypothetical protein
MKHGRGREKNANGDTYEGEYVRGKLSGKGLCIFADGTSYNGEWRDG